jgi:NAD(P)-dependent dehydrogenase (short-subunit alcohol dehydrogenase family)
MTVMNTQLLNRSVLVTGGSSGIGRATAIAYGREGARVALTYRSDLDAANRVAAEVEAAGGEAVCVRLDLSEPASIDSAVEQVVRRLDGLDVLVANAVRWPYDAQEGLAESDPVAWERAMRANLEGTARTVRAAWPALAASGAGRVVLVSTGVTRTGMPGSSAYATAKAGLEGLASALKWEGAETGILVNTVAPGFTVTDRNLATFGDEVRETVRERTPSGRLSAPDDIASAIVYLGSQANANITGVYLPVAGGTD